MQKHSTPSNSRRSRRLWSYRDVIAIYMRTNGRCGLCHWPVDPQTVVLDHIIPIARGGPDESANLQVACESCNQQKMASYDDMAKQPADRQIGRAARIKERIEPYQLLMLPFGETTPTCLLIAMKGYCRITLDCLISCYESRGQRGRWMYGGAVYNVYHGPRFRIIPRRQSPPVFRRG